MEAKINKLAWGFGILAVVLLVAFVFVVAHPKIVNVPGPIVEKVVNHTEYVDNPALVNELNSTKEKLASYKEVIAEEDQDNSWFELVKSETDRRAFKEDLKDFLNDELNLSIDDREDITDIRVNDFEDWEVEASDSDREDGDAEVTAYFRAYFYENDHKSEDDKQYIKVVFEVEENDVSDYSFELK
jgi:hypothetical protein